MDLELLIKYELISKNIGMLKWTVECQTGDINGHKILENQMNTKEHIIFKALLKIGNSN